MLAGEVAAAFAPTVVLPEYEFACNIGSGSMLVRFPAELRRAEEAGTHRPHVVLVHLMFAVQLDRFEPAAVARLSSKSMGRVDQILRTALHL